MELESWLIAIENIFEKFNEALNYERIQRECGVSLVRINPENEIFHPAGLVNKIMGIVGDSYDKKKGEVNKFMGRIQKQDFINLINNEKCTSFNQYCASLEINT